MCTLRELNHLRKENKDLKRKAANLEVPCCAHSFCPCLPLWGRVSSEEKFPQEWWWIPSQQQVRQALAESGAASPQMRHIGGLNQGASFSGRRPSTSAGSQSSRRSSSASALSAVDAASKLKVFDTLTLHFIPSPFLWTSPFSSTVSPPERVVGTTTSQQGGTRFPAGSMMPSRPASVLGGRDVHSSLSMGRPASSLGSTGGSTRLPSRLVHTRPSVSATGTRDGKSDTQTSGGRQRSLREFRSLRMRTLQWCPFPLPCLSAASVLSRGHASIW